MEKVTSIPRPAARGPEAHKGDFGRVMVVAGGLGMTGAAAMTALSALRGGAGLVRVASPTGVLPIVLSFSPCYTSVPLPEDADGLMSAEAAGVLLAQVREHDVTAFGPGVGRSASVRQVLLRLTAERGARLVIDADGLNNLAQSADWIQRRRASAILTPHPGEMKRLWRQAFREAMPVDRIEQAGRYAERSGCVVVLKGAGTVVTDGRRVYVNETGNPGMATGGSGDVLTGVIAALCGQGMGDFDAAVLGVHVHGLAGDLAARAIGQVSLIATDVIDQLGNAFLQLESEWKGTS